MRPGAPRPSPDLALVGRPGGCGGEQEAAETGRWMSLPAASRRGRVQKAGENGIRRAAPRRPSPRECEASHTAKAPAIYSLPVAERNAEAHTCPARSDNVTTRPANPAPRRFGVPGAPRLRHGPAGQSRPPAAPWTRHSSHHRLPSPSR